MAQANQNISDTNKDLQTPPMDTSSTSASSNSHKGVLMSEKEACENVEIHTFVDLKSSWMTYEGKPYTFKTPMEIAELRSKREEADRLKASGGHPRSGLEGKQEKNGA